MCSVAVPAARFARHENRTVELYGWGRFVVDDACAGDGCADFEVFVGDDIANAQHIPNWQLGTIPVYYRWISEEEIAAANEEADNARDAEDTTLSEWSSEDPSWE